MAYDTIKLKSPALLKYVVDHVQNQCFLRTGVEMQTGDVRYEIFAGELLGSWDARISVIPKYEDFVLNSAGRPVLVPCEPYLVIEASVHKIFTGHNVYGGPTDFQDVCAKFIKLIATLLNVELPNARMWTVHRVDVALVYKLSKPACKEFFDGMQLISFPRRKKGSAKYAMAVYFAGKTTTVKFYHKGSEFAVHEKARLRNFFFNLFNHLHGVDDPKNKQRVERKIQALQRLADNRLRVEVEIHSDKLQYDYEKNPRVDEVTDSYLAQVYDKEVEKLLREGKQGMDTVKETRAVMRRLQMNYGKSSGTRLYGFWSSLCTLGDEVTKEQFPKTVFYRNRKQLEDAGVSWRGTDIQIIANDKLIPHDFSPIRSDKRLCYLPARNREMYNVSRETMRQAA
ncbi:phage/plasmid replication protein, II/X family [Solimicrobium silvestre]|uniref:Phage/plasmid replication protein, protein II/X family n=1 Tax=Solimicrobium silvestre TaxID=2099400 RepID=A0A2S9GTM3_9BURK|nr:phage/plasmid replication protein, II/X family [Solimicrobium silvestre]PRC91038.1 Phage/plasmid replication protein, protein II/X family [Solimicrobium silvestre]